MDSMRELIEANEQMIEAQRAQVRSAEAVTTANNQVVDTILAVEIATASLRLSRIACIPPMVIASAIQSVMPMGGLDHNRLRELRKETERIVRERERSEPY